MSYIGQGLPADTFQGFTTDKFTGDGTANKAFTLTKEPFSEDTILVTIDGVVQEPTDDFTVSGTTLTLVGTAPNNSEVNVTHMGGPLPIGGASELDLNGASDKLILDADGDTTISADTDDQIDIKIGGADDFAFKANNFEVQSGSTIDMNGQELILDSDADTSITADTDDKIEFKCGGLDTVNINKFGQVVHTRDSATTFGGSTSFIHQRGTIASPSVVNSGDTLGMIQTTAYDGTAYLDGARILFQVDGTPGDDDMPTRIVFQTTADGTAGTLTEAMRIGNGGHIGIGVDTQSNKVRILQDQADENCVQIEYDTSSADESVMRWFCDRAAASAWDFLQAYSNNASSADLEFQMTSGGNMTADGSFSGSGADYAEYFETADGNGIEIGKTVVLDGNKVRASTSSDDASAIIGVVRPKEDGKCSMTIGNTAWNHWTDKYLTDDFGVFIWEDYTVKEWTETINNADGTTTTKNHSYPSDFIPEGVTAPADAKVLTQQRKKQNPDWNKDTEYVKRQDRKEWVIIGLLGQIPINKNEKTGTNWIKMRDISDTVEEWLVR